MATPKNLSFSPKNLHTSVRVASKFPEIARGIVPVPPKKRGTTNLHVGAVNRARFSAISTRSPRSRMRACNYPRGTLVNCI